VRSGCRGVDEGDGEEGGDEGGVCTTRWFCPSELKVRIEKEDVKEASKEE